MNRRSFFGMLLAPLVVPVIKALPVQTEQPVLIHSHSDSRVAKLWDREMLREVEARDELAYWFNDRIERSFMKHAGKSKEYGIIHIRGYGTYGNPS
jgi:hypothetical protein